MKKGLKLNKQTIAKLNSDQLDAVKGGNSQALAMETDCRDDGVTCNGAGSTIIIKTES